MKNYIFTLLKGFAMGAANVIPGVSGGTIALITGIFERLINAIKSFNPSAFKLLLKKDFKGFAVKTDLFFVITLFAGMGIAVISLAKLLEYLFENYPVLVWAFFFGLVMASVWFVARTVKKWHMGSVLTFIIGAAVALFISIMTPASENSAVWYLFICGIVAICSMILPGLSGSFVLILMGNYHLIMIDAVSRFKMDILIPVGAGAVFGIIAFSHLLSWLLKKFYDSTMALLTGFILGSLLILWPWKENITQTFGEKIKIIGYNWKMPEFNSGFFIALLFIILGISTIIITETIAHKYKKNDKQ